jgi:urate oxidase
VSCSWRYEAGVTDIDYDEKWTTVRECIVRSWGGHPTKGVLSSCMQFTLHSAGKSVLEAVPEIVSIDMLMPNLLYAPFDVETFKSVVVPQANRKIFQRVVSPSGLAAATIKRKDITNGNFKNGNCDVD